MVRPRSGLVLHRMAMARVHEMGWPMTATPPPVPERCLEDSVSDDGERCGAILVDGLCPTHDRDIFPPPPAPDTRPRCGESKDGYACGLEQGHVTAWHEHFRQVGGSMVWATDAQPAPTPSGDSSDARPVLGVTASGETVSPQQAIAKVAEVARLIAESDPDVIAPATHSGVRLPSAMDEMITAVSRHHRHPVPTAALCPTCIANAAEFRDHVLLESAAALQEARERMGAADRELSALSSDKQTLMTATTHWRERAEAAETRLAMLIEEVEALGPHYRMLAAASRPAPAATRPAPAAPQEEQNRDS